MSEFLGSPPARPRPQPDQARTLEMLATLFLVAFVVTILYVGREIFIPIAIAILVSFVLSPPIVLLRRLGLGRAVAVLTVVFAALVIAFSVSAVLTRQVSELAGDLPLYQATINAKLDDLRDVAADNVLFAKVSATSFKEALAFYLPKAVEEDEGGPGKIGAKPAAKFSSTERPKIVPLK